MEENLRKKEKEIETEKEKEKDKELKVFSSYFFLINYFFKTNIPIV